MQDWYYAQHGQKHGPVSQSELLELIRSGDVDRDNLVWTTGMEDWEPAYSISDLLDSDRDDPPDPPLSIDDTETRSEDPDAGEIADEKQASATDSTISYAGFWKRFFALIVDVIIIIIPSAFISVPFLSSAPQGDAGSLANVIVFMVGWMYYSNMESSKKQATLGKMLLGIKVTDVDGERIDFGKASGRHFGKIISGAIIWIGYIMAAFTEKKQALHDKMAGCLVINQ